jgi:hypothetical protein
VTVDDVISTWKMNRPRAAAHTTSVVEDTIPVFTGIRLIIDEVSYGYETQQ